jgi:DNA primase
LLDRALWLLLHRCELWTALDGESHDILAAGGTPHDALFGGIERSLLEHGPIGHPALLEELRTLAQAEGSGAIVARVAAFHDPEPTMDFAQELRTLLDRLRLQAVEEELKSLFESGTLSPDAQQRGRHLMALQARLKSALSKVTQPG